jgi:hypothetical protein
MKNSAIALICLGVISGCAKPNSSSAPNSINQSHDLNTSPSGAQCFVVSPSGAGAKTGADWNNAYAGLPSTLVRGAIYYLADGSYSPYTFNTPVSGTSTVEIRKAQSYDNCTSTGWSISTMGSSQAVFTHFQIEASYFTINGNGSQTTPGCGGAVGSTYTSGPSNPMDCGIKIAPQTASNGDAVYLNSGFTNFTMNYVEMAGTGQNPAENTLVASNGNNNFLTSFHVYGHNSGCMYYAWLNDSQSTSFSYFWWVNSNGSCHPEYYMGGAAAINSGSEHNNIYRDINGTSTFAFVSPAEPANNLQIYDNVFWVGPEGTNGSGNDDGIFWCGNDTNCSNLTFVQNTVINEAGNNSGLVGSNDVGTVTGIVENNLIYGSVNTNNMVSGVTEDYNSWINSPCPSGTGAHDICISSGGPNPFVNWQAGNFSLASDNADWNNRISLSSPYNIDAAGNSFTTDRGAYQYGGVSSTPTPTPVPTPVPTPKPTPVPTPVVTSPNPPTDLRIVGDS